MTAPDEYGEDRPTAVWELPPGVTFAEARDVYAKLVQWGVADPDVHIQVYGGEPVKPCVPVPCPSFSGGWQREAWENTATGRALRELAEAEQAAWTSEERQWAHLRMQVAFHGSAYVDAALLPLLVTVDPDSDPYRRAVRGVVKAASLANPLPTVEEALSVPPPVRWAGTGRPQVALPEPAEGAALIVGVPSGHDAEALAAAIALCQSAGLLPDTPHGILFVPEGIDSGLLD